MTSLRVMIVDDHPVVREGLRAVMTREPGLEVVGEAGDGAAAADLAQSVRPDLAVIDVSMPRGNGAEATRRVLARSPDTKVIALSMHEEPTYVRALLRAGARGYVLKRTVLRDLLRAIDVVVGGGLFLDPELAARAFTDAPADFDTSRGELTERETDVARLTALGCTNTEIAAELSIAAKTVETYKSRLMAKLGLQNRAQLVRYAIYRGWLNP